MTDTAKLRELLAAGTQGEWSVTDEHEILSTENRNDPIDGEPYQERTLIAQGECSQNWGYIEWFNLADAALIVAAVNALPALLDEVEALRAALSAEPVDDRIGKWLSAALEDSSTCAEMKADIEAWFAARAEREA